MPVVPNHPVALRKRPFLGSEAIAAGLVTANQLRGRSWRRLFRDVYVDAAIEDSIKTRAAGAALLLPEGAVFTGRTAALLWGARLVDGDGPIEVLTQRRFGPVEGLSIRLGPLADDERSARGGLPVCSAVHTAWELARALPVTEAVEWVDALGHARALTKKALVGHAARHDGEYGFARAAATLALCDPAAESPPESRLRLALVTAGVAEPMLQHMVLVDGEFVARVDLAWPQLRFAIEYDGQWHVDPVQLGEDRRRLRDLVAAGWQVFHVTREDLRDLGQLVAAVRAALARRARELGVA